MVDETATLEGARVQGRVYEASSNAAEPSSQAAESSTPTTQVDEVVEPADLDDFQASKKWRRKLLLASLAGMRETAYTRACFDSVHEVLAYSISTIMESAGTAIPAPPRDRSRSNQQQSILLNSREYRPLIGEFSTLDRFTEALANRQPPKMKGPDNSYTLTPPALYTDPTSEFDAQFFKDIEELAAVALQLLQQ